MVEPWTAVQGEEGWLLSHVWTIGYDFGALNVEKQPHVSNDHFHSAPFSRTAATILEQRRRTYGLLYSHALARRTEAWGGKR